MHPLMDWKCISSVVTDWLSVCLGEESFLIQFFGAEYLQYRQDTPVGIPLIR